MTPGPVDIATAAPRLLGPVVRRLRGEDAPTDGARPDPAEQAILFTALAGFEEWTARVEGDESLAVLRRVHRATTAAVAGHDGRVVKRLDGGLLAVFPDAVSALAAGQLALAAVAEIEADGYAPRLHAGLHLGAPRPVGDDVLGVDVNVAARLCEAAGPDEILVSDVVLARLDGARRLLPRGRLRRQGVPGELEAFVWRLPRADAA